MDNGRIGLTTLRLIVPNTSLFSPLTFMYLMFYGLSFSHHPFILVHDDRYRCTYKGSRENYCLRPCSMGIPAASSAPLPRPTQCRIVEGFPNHNGISGVLDRSRFSVVGTYGGPTSSDPSIIGAASQRFFFPFPRLPLSMDPLSLKVVIPSRLLPKRSCVVTSMLGLTRLRGGCGPQRPFAFTHEATLDWCLTSSKMPMTARSVSSYSISGTGSALDAPRSTSRFPFRFRFLEVGMGGGGTDGGFNPMAVVPTKGNGLPCVDGTG